MGVVQCTIHGSAGFALCCEHIGDAVDEARFERANVFMDEYASNLLCEACYQEAAHQATDMTNGRVFDLQLGSRIQPHCPDCVRDWCATTGQGDVWTEVARANRSRFQRDLLTIRRDDD